MIPKGKQQSDISVWGLLAQVGEDSPREGTEGNWLGTTETLRHLQLVRSC